jgi:hypothetical protein
VTGAEHHEACITFHKEVATLHNSHADKCESDGDANFHKSMSTAHAAMAAHHELCKLDLSSGNDPTAAEMEGKVAKRGNTTVIPTRASAILTENPAEGTRLIFRTGGYEPPTEDATEALDKALGIK